MKKQWRLIIDNSKSGAFNMATDHALLESLSADDAPILRFYQWQPPCLSLGYFQNEKEINQQKCSELAIDLVRRPTGGRAVLHKDELTYAVIMPQNYLESNLLKTYRVLSTALVKGLSYLNVNSEISAEKRRIGGDSLACFDAPGSSEIMVEGRKFIGSAQTRRGNNCLQHGSIPIYNNNSLLAQLLYNDEIAQKRLVKILDQKAIALTDLTGIKARYQDHQQLVNDLINALIKGFQQQLALNFYQQDLTAKEERLIVNMQQQRYQTLDNKEAKK